jgi:predicted RNase H-like HicB family nuclease
MQKGYTAVVQQRERWWIGWIEEIPGVNSQGATREELIGNLASALEEALELDLADVIAVSDRNPFDPVSSAA